jgi:hypothetical protein
MIFSDDVYNYLKVLVSKMAKTPMRHPMNPQMFVQDEQGQIVYMNRTGKIEELIHTALLQSVSQLIMADPSFLPEDPSKVPPQIQILQWMEMYGNYVSKYFDGKVATGSNQNGGVDKRGSQQQQPNGNRNNNIKPNNNYQ